MSPKGADSPQFKHGRYAKFAPQRIREKIEAFGEADPLDLVDELAMQRALFAEYLSRFEVGTSLTAFDISSLMGWSAEIGRTVERIMKIRNDSALTAAEITYLQARILDVVGKYISEPEKQRQFIAELFGVDEDRPRHPELVGGETSD